MDSETSSSNETFMYFAYGSNLLSRRIHFQNPTAVRRGTGKLKDYRLDFNTQSRNWNGCSATIVEHEGRYVWGAVWEIDMANMADLDRQEGVERNLYKALTKDVETPNGERITCRVYQKVTNPEETYELEDLPLDRQPSRTYLTCILKGAEESQLPVEYIDKLKRIPHNNRDANNMTFRELCE
ncbi:hypothetical protein HA402_013108 [Bradysia odoriphaga]|nr:hypothetical protein HA402_013108 [Bradysia odoriphaga]